MSGRLLNDQEEIVLETIQTIYNYAAETDACRAIIANDRLMTGLVQALSIYSDNSKIVTQLVGILHYISHHNSGLLVLFKCDVIAPLVRHLSLRNVSVTHDALATLHNLMWKQIEPKRAIYLAGGIPRLLRLFHLDNIQLVSGVTHCLAMLAHSSPTIQQIIVDTGGLRKVLHILSVHVEEALLHSALILVSVLSVNAYNRRRIVEAGGFKVLTVAMYQNRQWSLFAKACLSTIYQLSGTIMYDRTMTHEDNYLLLSQLMGTFTQRQMDLIPYAIGIMYNITQNNLTYRKLLSMTRIVQVLLDLVLVTDTEREDITEMAFRILGNLTAQQPFTELVRDCIRNSYHGIRIIVKMLDPTNKYTLIKSAVQLIRNMAMSSINCRPLRRAHAVHRLVQLLKKSEQDIVSVAIEHLLLFFSLNIFYSLKKILKNSF